MMATVDLAARRRAAGRCGAMRGVAPVRERATPTPGASGGPTPACTRTSRSPCIPIRSRACTAGTRPCACKRAEAGRSLRRHRRRRRRGARGLPASGWRARACGPALARRHAPALLVAPAAQAGAGGVRLPEAPPTRLCERPGGPASPAPHAPEICSPACPSRSSSFPSCSLRPAGGDARLPRPVRGRPASPFAAAPFFASSPLPADRPVALTALLTFGALSELCARRVATSTSRSGILLALVVGITRLACRPAPAPGSSPTSSPSRCCSASSLRRRSYHRLAGADGTRPVSTPPENGVVRKVAGWALFPPRLVGRGRRSSLSVRDQDRLFLAGRRVHRLFPSGAARGAGSCYRQRGSRLPGARPSGRSPHAFLSPFSVDLPWIRAALAGWSRASSSRSSASSSPLDRAHLRRPRAHRSGTRTASSSARVRRMSPPPSLRRLSGRRLLFAERPQPHGRCAARAGKRRGNRCSPSLPFSRRPPPCRRSRRPF